MIAIYRDPVYDGATDPKVVIDRTGRWWMLYTQRRANLEDAGPGVSWVHGSRIGVATSADGVSWHYEGTLEPDAAGLRLEPGAPPAEVDRTHWAPEVIHDGRRWRMYLTEIDGVPERWPGFARTIVEYVSEDLRRWRRIGPLTLSSDRVIDAAVARTPDGTWRLWFKDEAADSTTVVASSPDLGAWSVEGVAIGGRPHEGPTAFEWGGCWWMIVDEWRGMAVHRSDDGIRWTRQGGEDAVILAEAPGGGHGNHGSPVRDGDALWFYWFALADGAAPHRGTGERRCTAIHRVRLDVDGGSLVVRASDSDRETL